MATFESILSGKRERKTVEFPVPLDPENPEKKILVDIVVLAGDEEATALACAREYAKGKGVADPKSGDPHYDLGVMVHTLARALLDHDVPGSFVFFANPAGAPKDFEQGAAALLARLDRERIQYLFTLYQVWQDESSPWGSEVKSEDQMLQVLFRLRGVTDPKVPFEQMRPALVGSCLLFTANRLFALLQDKSEPGSSSDSNTKTEPSSPASSTPSDGAS